MINKGMGPASKPHMNVDADDIGEKKSYKGIFLRLSKYVLKSWPLFILAIAITLLSNQLALMAPRFSGEAIDAIASEGGIDFYIVQTNVVKMLLCYIASAILSYLLTVLMVNISQKIVYTMRKELFEKLTSLPVGYFDKHPTGTWSHAG